MLGTGTVTIEFEEPDLTARIPGCVEVVAAALFFHYRLVPAPQVGHEDFIEGATLKRLQQWKDARRAPSKLKRWIRWHFLATKVSLFGEETPTPVKVFFRRWEEEPALRRAVTTHPNWERTLNVVRSALLARPRTVVLAAEGGRFCFGKLGGDPETLRDFANMMEEGIE